MNSTSINHRFVSIQINIHYRTFYSHRYIIPITRTYLHLGYIIKDKITRTDFISDTKPVSQRTRWRISNRNFQLWVTVYISLLYIFQHPEIVFVNLHDFFLRTSMISMTGMSQKTFKFYIYIRSYNIDYTVNLFIIVSINSISMVAGIHS